jgi:hypothetical protein
MAREVQATFQKFASARTADRNRKQSIRRGQVIRDIIS